MQKEEEKSVAIVHKPQAKSSSNYEDMVTSIGVITVSLAFLIYVTFLSIAQMYQIEDQNTQEKDALGGVIQPFFSNKPDCAKMDENFDACVKSQAEGSGCSWYAGCRKCIVGSHNGKSREEICEK